MVARLLALVVVVSPCLTSGVKLQHGSWKPTKVLVGACQIGDEHRSGGMLLRKAEAATYPWACKNGDALRTGWSKHVAPFALAKGPSWSFQEETSSDWKQKLARRYHDWKGLVRAAPLIDDKGNIYITTVTTGNVYKLTPKGQQLWKYHAGGRSQIPAVSALLAGRFFLGTDRGEVIALDMQSGEECWRTKAFEAAAGDTWSLTASDGVIISPGAEHSGMNNRLLTALNATTGERLWSFRSRVADLFNTLVAVKDGSAVFSDAKGTVYRLELATGKQVWKTSAPPAATFTTGGTMVGSNCAVYTTWNEGIASGMNWGHGMVGAFDFRTGSKIWSTNVEYMANNAAVVGHLPDGSMGVVIGVGQNPDAPRPEMGIKDGQGPPKKQRIVALDANTGAFIWKYDLPDWHGSALGDEKRPDICLPDAFGNAAIGGDGTVYVGHASGLFYSIKDSNSDGHITPKEVSSWQTGAAFQGTAAIAPHLLAAASCDGLHVWHL